MGWKENLTKLKDSFFEQPDTPPPEEEPPQIPAEPLLLLEQAEGSTINGDINSAAQQLLEEELARVTSSDDENTIFKVESCIQFVGEFAPPETVCMMLQNVAGKDPAVLAEDGNLRITTIEQFIKDTASQAKIILQEASDEAEKIKNERISLSSAYADSCDAAHKHYDEKVRELQEELEGELKSLKEQNDTATAELEERSKENAKRREDAQNLSRAVDTLGRSMIERISKLLALITPSNKSDSN